MSRIRFRGNLLFYSLYLKVSIDTERPLGFGKKYTTWLGIKRLDVGSSSEKFVYANNNVEVNANLLNSMWDSGQFDKVDDCAIFGHQGQNNKWFRTNCNEKHRFVCECLPKGSIA